MQAGVLLEADVLQPYDLPDANPTDLLCHVLDLHNGEIKYCWRARAENVDVVMLSCLQNSTHYLSVNKHQLCSTVNSSNNTKILIVITT